MSRQSLEHSQGTDIDPISLALTQNRLDDICRQMGWVMTRTARSPIFSDSHDFSCFITDHEGTLVSQADGIPIHTGGGGFTVAAILSAFGERISEGDVFVSSDPYAAGGNHLPDWVISRPIVTDGQLIGFTCNRAHQSDIGGGAAGTYNARATEIWHEGIRLPPLRIVEQGVMRQDLWRLLLLNSRTPDLMDGDLRAMVGSTRIGVERVNDLARELGVGTTVEFMAAILDHGESRLRSALKTLPEGRYESVEYTHTDCFEEVDIAIRAAVTIDKGHATVDFTGSDPQMRGFKNSSLVNTHSAVYLAITSYFEADLPRNGGAFRAIDVVAPLGTVVNPRPPAPLSMCTATIAHEIGHSVWKAMAVADPERACAGWGKSIHGITAGGMGTPSPWVMYHWNTLSGSGAVKGRDGFNQFGHVGTLGGITMHNIENYEQRYPVQFVRQEFRRDSAGSGEFRGGTGIDYEVMIGEEAEYSFRGEGLIHPSGYGTNGGTIGEPGRMTLTFDDSAQIEAPQYGVETYAPLQLHALSPGGGGWGNPFKRDARHVLRDTLDGVVSPEAAETVYGVALSSDRREIDLDKTNRLRDVNTTTDA
ncbi:MAG: hydantoinase [Alphaproteobacteria bacterium]|nr:hydantoinase [Alphaproteobacteria bacterium]